MNYKQMREYSKKCLKRDIEYRKELRLMLNYFRRILDSDNSSIDKCSVCGMLREWSEDCYSCTRDEWYYLRDFKKEIECVTFSIQMHINNLKMIKKEEYDRCKQH